MSAVRLRRRAAPVVLALVGVLAPAACSAGDLATGSGSAGCPESVAANPATPVIAATATSAEPAPVLPERLRARLRTSALRGDDVCVALLSPQGDLEVFGVTARRANGQIENGRREALTDANLDAVSARLRDMAAQDDGLDPIGAFDRVSRLPREPGTLYLITSGISTRAPVDLRVLGWGLDPAAQAGALDRGRQLPDLTGWTVELIGLGDAAGAQPSPAIPQRGKLQAWWVDICRQAGATCAADPEKLTAEPSRSRNDVPTVDLPTAVTVGDTVTLPESLTFAIDSADVEASADPALEAVVARAAETGAELSVFGNTDAVTGSAAHNRVLSRQRAAAVADRLTDLGLPADRIRAVRGLGSGRASLAREREDPRQVDADRNVQIVFHRP